MKNIETFYVWYYQYYECSRLSLCWWEALQMMCLTATCKEHWEQYLRILRTEEFPTDEPEVIAAQHGLIHAPTRRELEKQQKPVIGFWAQIGSLFQCQCA
jgi:hypothetical protein